MRILVVHNRYQQQGGEDVVCASEIALLQRFGHTVNLLQEDNARIQGAWSKARAALSAVYSLSSRERVAKEIRQFRPDIVHVHNPFPLFSYSTYDACHRCRIPVVQTLHNYRFVCPKATLSRRGKTCETCVDLAFAWPAVIAGCYKTSRMGTASIAMGNWARGRLQSWRGVSVFIALSEFSRGLFVRGGLPPERIVVKPNFVHDTGGRCGENATGAVFVGRLIEEKGIRMMLQAWNDVHCPEKLTIIGDGPLRGEVQSAAATIREIEYLGALPKSAVIDALRRAAFLILPSLWYEGLPMVLIEAFAAGLPVVASKIGSLAEAVAHEQTGLHFSAGDVSDLAKAVTRLARDPELRTRLGEAARREYLLRYTPERNYVQMMSIYHAANQRAHGLNS